jgi:hypothetical protein
MKRGSAQQKTNGFKSIENVVAARAPKKNDFFGKIKTKTKQERRA